MPPDDPIQQVTDHPNMKDENTMNAATETKTIANIVDRLNAKDAAKAASSDAPTLDDGPIGADNATREPASTRDVGAQTVPLSVIVDELTKVFPGRGEAMLALALAKLAGEHALLVGPPGTAKSALVRAFSHATSMRVWEHLMTRFTTPDEVLGPVKLSALQADRFERAIEGYLPTAQVVFLDEVFKSNSAILNALLGALNERQITEGANVIRIPLHTCVGASNEVPDPDDGLEAIYDRFLVRTRVEYLPSDSPDFVNMLASTTTIGSLRADLAAEHAATRKVGVGRDTLDAVAALRAALAREATPITMSDRRWKQSLRILRAHAHLNGRTQVDPELDLSALIYVIPNRPQDVKIVETVIAKSTNPIAAKCAERVAGAKDAVKRMAKIDGLDAGAALTTIGGTVREVTAILADLATLPEGKARTKAENEVTKILAGLKAKASEVAMKAAGV